MTLLCSTNSLTCSMTVTESSLCIEIKTISEWHNPMSRRFAVLPLGRSLKRLRHLSRVHRFIMDCMGSFTLHFENTHHAIVNARACITLPP
ncbi:hypothetical protein A0H81_14543 [Grifola frondosa]|uniref:Uncharacterized protein n=1 Tax=Grifola frondosa TaxID=5627 RepID=A0A1C7LN70_GRIFR|nr:hypothetical protein A0H81_14543 [Grifola frondosa]